MVERNKMSNPSLGRKKIILTLKIITGAYSGDDRTRLNYRLRDCRNDNFDILLKDISTFRESPLLIRKHLVNIIETALRMPIE